MATQKHQIQESEQKQIEEVDNPNYEETEYEETEAERLHQGQRCRHCIHGACTPFRL